jgi:hypothetical protein
MPASWWEQLKALLPDYSGVAQAMPENIGREKIMDPLVNAGIGLATLPQRALGSSAEAVTSGIYNPAPIVEAAMLPMGTGAFAGPVAAAGETALGAGILRPKPVVGGYHATTIDFDKFAPGFTHFSRDPNVSRQFSMGYPGAVLYTEGSRTIPVIGDIQSPLVLNHPAARNIRDWKDPFEVQTAFDAMSYNNEIHKTLPKSLLGKIEKLPEDNTQFVKAFSDTLKDAGYDSVRYPHSGSRLTQPDAYMALDSSQVVPKFSPEGQELIKARGILEPSKDLKWNEKWRKRWEEPGQYWSPRHQQDRYITDDEWAGKVGINYPSKQVFRST